MKKSTTLILIVAIIIFVFVALTLWRYIITTEIKTTTNNPPANDIESTDSVVYPPPENIICLDNSDCEWISGLSEKYGGCGCFNRKHLENIKLYDDINESPIRSCEPPPNKDKPCVCASSTLPNTKECRVNTDWTNLDVKSPVTLDQAIAIGKTELKRRSYPTEDMRVETDENNSLWQEFITKNPSELQSPIVKKLRLEEKKYWAIYYAPKENSLGGDAWIFVDINTGEIIGVILGE